MLISCFFVDKYKVIIIFFFFYFRESAVTGNIADFQTGDITFLKGKKIIVIIAAIFGVKFFEEKKA